MKTPKEIVDMLGNISNRQDINDMKKEQVRLIEEYGRMCAEAALESEWNEIGHWKPYLHWCMDWDGLLIDRNDPEFSACGCFGDDKPDLDEQVEPLKEDDDEEPLL
jgi:hypothetical protein